MATKKITKGGNYNINVNSKSKDTVYVLANESLASEVTFNFINAKGYNSKFLKPYKKGNDLILTTVYDEKLITNTIKDYFKYNTSYPDLVKQEGTAINPYSISTGYANGLFSDANYIGGVILGSMTSDNYIISKNQEGSRELHDFGGNDNYDISAKHTGQNNLNLTDYAGDDKQGRALSKDGSAS